MLSIRHECVPGVALLRTYRGGRHPERWRIYQDCFSIDVGRRVGLLSSHEYRLPKEP